MIYEPAPITRAQLSALLDLDADDLRIDSLANAGHEGVFYASADGTEYLVHVDGSVVAQPTEVVV